MAPRVGFVGLGHTGAPIAANLAAHRLDVAVYDRDEDRVAALVRNGTRPAAGLDEVAAGRDAVLLALPGPVEVEDVVVASGRLLERVATGTCVVSLSTISPALARRLDAAGRPRGIDVLDAPVSGAADGARAGTLTIMAGGDPEVVERARPLLEPLASAIVHVGACRRRLRREARHQHALGRARRCPRRRARPRREGRHRPGTVGDAVCRSAGGSWVAEHDLRNLLAREDDESFPLALCRKDLRLIAELAADTAAPTPLATVARERSNCARTIRARGPGGWRSRASRRRRPA